MAHRARTHRLTRRSWLAAGLGMGVSARAFWGHGSPELVSHCDGDTLYVSAPDFHFVLGKPLEKLMYGDSVSYVAQLSLSYDDNRTVFRRQGQRFIFSRGVWDEKFYVVSGSRARKQFATAEKAEAWCVDNLSISIAGIPPDKPVWLRLDVRVLDAKDPVAKEDSPMTLRKLIDIFARPAPAQSHWVLDQPPFRLEDLKRSGRG